ncbi:MAG: DUF402 domain-containing protein [Lachnospiraceae bacterium]|nr:DUF402 domain-containing protein [Lachnospiraceae bacterium]
MNLPLLFRKRIIPEECIPLKDDEILYIDDEIIVTKWNVLKPRPDFHHGYSCYFLNKNIKVSKFIEENGDLHYWYCDIIEQSYNERDNSYTFTDLLADVIVYPDGTVRVVDLDEIAVALERKMLSERELSISLRALDSLLNMIYKGDFDFLKSKIEQFIN